jgi:two-component system, chemotaxis family, CheB/CheR fusion protein
MSRLSPPVAFATGHPRSRSAHSRGISARRRAPTYEKIRPADVGLGELFVCARDALIVGNVDSGSIALWNPAAERLFGWTAAEAIGQPIDILIPSPIVRLHQQGLALHRAGGHANLIDSGSGVEVPALTRDGQEVRVELSLTSLHNSNAPGRFVLAMLRDVSDRRRADMQAVEAVRAEAARGELEQRLLEQQRTFDLGAADVERELSLVRRSAERLSRALSRDDASPRRLRQRARIVELRTERARRVLDEVAISTAMRAGSLSVNAERVNLVPLVSRVVADVRARSTPCKVNVSVPQGLTAIVDAVRIEQLVRSLVERAMRRNPRGCWVDIELRRPLVGQVRLEVRDAGRQVLVAARERLLNGDRGLALCRHIVEQHGGALHVDFPAEGGVRIVATLPTQRARVSN